MLGGNASNPSPDIQEEGLVGTCGVDGCQCCNPLETAAIAPSLAVMIAERPQLRYDIWMVRSTGKRKLGAQKPYRVPLAEKLTYGLGIAVLG